MMLFPTPFSPFPVQALGDVSAIMIEITAAHIAALTNYHTFFVVASAGCKVYWGDGASSTLSAGTTTCTHTYAGAGCYLIQIKGAHTKLYHGTGSTAAKVIEAVKLYSGVTSCASTFRDCLNDKFKMGNGLRFHNGITDCLYSFLNSSIKEIVPGFMLPVSCSQFFGMFQNDVNLESDISNIIPDWPTGRTITMSSIFYNAQKVTGTLPASKLWGRTDITWISTQAFTSATHLTNYASIPAGWK